MITFKKMTRWVFAIMVSSTLVFIASCGSDDDPPAPPVKPTISYPDTDVAIGSEGSVTPAVQGDAATYSIKDDTGTKDFVTIDANTGILSVAKESVLGEYKVVITATNSAGSSDAVATITISISDDFNPVGKTLLWKYFINQEDGFTLKGMDGIPQMPFKEIILPVGWPTAETAQEDVWKHFVLTEIEGLIFQVPNDNTCSISGDTLAFVVNEDLTLGAICTEGTPETTIGTASISYKDDAFVFTLELVFDDVIPIILPYNISNATMAEFTDPVDSRAYMAIQGTVNAFTTPTDLTDESTITDITSWATPKVDVVLEILP